MPLLLAVLSLFVLIPAAVAATGGAPPPAAALAIVLRPVVTVSGPIVRLGDVFLNAGAAAEKPLIYAPEPGRRLSLDMRWLYRVARAHGLDWQPATAMDQVTVERESMVVGRDELEERIFAELAGRGIDTGNLQLELAHGAAEVHLPADRSASLTIEDVAFDPRRGHFAAVFAVAGDQGAAQRTKVAGRLIETAEVPVLSRRFAPDEVIREPDVVWTTMPAHSLPKNAILSPEHLVGRAPRRSLAGGAPVRAGEVRPPVVVEKGDLVTLILTSGPMTLTARGRALEDGAQGAAIRVSNVRSRATLEAIVTGPGQVRVGPGFALDAQ
jgi:flagella basal body P-ring formation protein FlgA